MEDRGGKWELNLRESDIGNQLVMLRLKELYHIILGFTLRVV